MKLRTEDSSSAMRMRDIPSPLDIANERKLPEGMGDIHAIADDETVRTFEAYEIRLRIDGKLARLVEEHAGHDTLRAARGHEVLREGERAPRFEDVVDDEDVAAGNRGFGVAHDGDLAERARALAVARQRDEIHIGLRTRLVQRAQKIGGEDETALEDRHDERL